MLRFILRWVAAVILCFDAVILCGNYLNITHGPTLDVVAVSLIALVIVKSYSTPVYVTNQIMYPKPREQK